MGVIEEEASGSLGGERWKAASLVIETHRNMERRGSNVVKFVAALFFLMGAAGLFFPHFIFNIFSPDLPPTADWRNEIRAVYGGFGVAVSLILLGSTSMTAEVGRAVQRAIALQCFGMAGGRAFSFIFDYHGMSVRVFPWIFFFVELVGGYLLVAASEL